MINFKEPYNRDDFVHFLSTLLPDFKADQENIKVSNNFKHIKSINKIGVSNLLDIKVFEIEHESDRDPRISLSRESFSLMKQFVVHTALVIFKNSKSQNYRLSLITFESTWEEGTKIRTKFSNPKRYSFFLGPNAKINTPTRFLVLKGGVSDFEDLKNRFSIEVVNKEFYKEISEVFTKLVDGLLKLPSTDSKSQVSLEFAVRLIGRVIFCWFLREKKSTKGLSLMPKEILSYDAVNQYENYYHKILEPIFFEVLNKTVISRREDFIKEPFSNVPYLNGGLFSPQEDDFYKRTNGDLQSQFQNTLVIPNTWLKDFFEILETYNFTIDENTSYDEELSIDPEMLGRIFENLLAEINPDTGESARKSTGSYYTPRVVVNYMVDESLLLYLKEKTHIDEEKLRATISYDLSDDSEIPTTAKEKELIIDALERIKILDPACGSGAFPIGALQKIVFILQQTDPDGQLWFKKQIKSTSPEIRRVIEREFQHNNFDYIRKLGIIRENIYGIDIQSIATEISRLRCFLTLVVDERIQDELENRGIEPLPNLEFKFVTANSLIGLPKLNEPTQSPQQSLGFDDSENIDKLKEIRDQYFNAFGIEREQLKTEFVMQQKRLVDQLIREHGYMGVSKAELTQKLTNWEPFTHKSTSWFDAEWMFGIKDGFDIIIGNPPYIQLQKSLNNGSDDKYADLYKKSGFITFDRTGDIYCLFYEKGLTSLKTGGSLSFITSNKWMRTDYGEKLRRMFLEFNPLILIDLGPGVFESATVDTNILLIQKSENRNSVQAVTINTKYEINISEYIKDNGIKLTALNHNVWFIGSEEEQRLKEKIEKIGKPLDDLDIEINYGIKTGFNEAFIIDQSTKEKLITEDPNCLEIIKPVLRGRDIKKYGYDFANIFIINTGFDLDVPSLYPAIYKFLLQFEKDLKLRQDQGKNWWNLRSCDYYEEFKKEKIIWQEISRDNAFSYSNSEIYCNDTGRIMTGNNIKYLLGIFNSTFFKFVFSKWYAGGGLGEKGIRFKGEFMKKFPIVEIVDRNQYLYDDLVSKVDRILEQKNNDSKADTNIFEGEIDQIIYKLYGLTEEEIKVVVREYD